MSDLFQDKIDPLFGKMKKPSNWKYLLLVLIIITGLIMLIYITIVPSPKSNSKAKNVEMSGFLAETSSFINVSSSKNVEIRNLKGQWYSSDNNMYINSFIVGSNIDMYIDSNKININKGILIESTFYADIFDMYGKNIKSNMLLSKVNTSIYSKNLTNGKCIINLNSSEIPIFVNKTFVNQDELIYQITCNIHFTFYHIQNSWFEFTAIHTIEKTIRYVEFEEKTLENTIKIIKYTGLSGLSFMGLAVVQKKRK